MNDPKHISQLSPTDRARTDELVRMALLAIVAGQAKTVTIPAALAEEIWSQNRLVIEHDYENGLIKLSSEEVGPLVIPANQLPV